MGALAARACEAPGEGNRTAEDPAEGGGVGRWRAPFVLGRPHFGGAFLLLPAALALNRIAERTLGKVLRSADKARRLALSLFFRALGIERIFPFETLDDLGFAVLTGGKRILSH